MSVLSEFICGTRVNKVITEDDSYPCLQLPSDLNKLPPMSVEFFIKDGEMVLVNFDRSFAVLALKYHREFVDRLTGILSHYVLSTLDSTDGKHHVRLRWSVAKIDVLASNDDRYTRLSFIGFKRQQNRLVN